MHNDKKEKFYKFKNPANLTNIAVMIFYIYLAISFILIISSFFQYNLLMELKHGLSLTAEMAHANDSRQYSIARWSIISFLISGVVYLTWLYRAINNARSFHPRNITFTPVWSIAWYFIPIVCLYAPYQDMQMLWKSSQNPHHWEEDQSSSLIKWWWFFWLGSNIILLVAQNLQKNAKDVDAVINLSITLISGYTGQAICAFLLILIMKEIYKKQINTYKVFRTAISTLP
jgi:hypothetical protein